MKLAHPPPLTAALLGGAGVVGADGFGGAVDRLPPGGTRVGVAEDVCSKRVRKGVGSW